MRPPINPQPRRELSANIWIQLALWMSFFGLFARALGPDNNLIRHGGRFLFDMATVVLIMASLPRLLSLSQRRQAQYNLVLLMLAVGLMAAVVGLVKGNSIVRWTLLGVLPFTSASASLLGDSEGLFECLLRTLLRQMILGVVFAGAVLLFARPEGRLEWNGEYGDGLAKVACRCLYMVPFLIPYIGRLGRGYNTLLALAYLELVVLHVIGANRGPIVALVLLVPGILFFSSIMSGDGFVSLRRMARMGAFLLLLLTPAVNLVLASNPTLLDYADQRISEMLQRMSGTSTEDDLLTTSEGALLTASDEFLGEQSRGGELRDFWQQLEPVDFACGRGYGGSWMSTFWGSEWYMVHVGPAHLLFVGGIPLLLAFSFMLLGSIAAAWRALPVHPAAAGTLCYLMVFAMGFMQHGAIQDDIEVSVYWILTGLAFAIAPETGRPLQSRPLRQSLETPYRKSLRQPQTTH